MEKTITERLKDLNKQYKELDELKKWMNTERGHQFAKLLKVRQLDMLIRDFKAPKVSVQGYKHKLNAYMSVKHSLGIKDRVIKPDANYAKNLRKLQESGKLKLPPNLTKKELHAMHVKVLVDIYGKPIQKTDRKGRLLWDTKTNTPIYKTVDKHKIDSGLALKCHMYELHKMARWDHKHPKPSPEQMKSFLFPYMLMQEWNTQRNVANERIRDDLSNKYCHGKTYTPPLRLFKVGIYSGESGAKTSYITEADPYVYGYPLTGMDETTPFATIQRRINQLKLYSNDIGFKVINKFGHVVATRIDDDIVRYAKMAA